MSANEYINGKRDQVKYDKSIDEELILKEYMQNPNDESYANLINTINIASMGVVVYMTDILASETENGKSKLSKEQYDELSKVLDARMKVDFTANPKYDNDRKRYSTMESYEAHGKTK